MAYACQERFEWLGLFEMVGHPVAVYPDRKLRALAEARGWTIIDGGKQEAEE